MQGDSYGIDFLQYKILSRCYSNLGTRHKCQPCYNHQMESFHMVASMYSLKHDESNHGKPYEPGHVISNNVGF